MHRHALPQGLLCAHGIKPENPTSAELEHQYPPRRPASCPRSPPTPGFNAGTLGVISSACIDQGRAEAVRTQVSPEEPGHPAPLPCSRINNQAAQASGGGDPAPAPFAMTLSSSRRREWGDRPGRCLQQQFTPSTAVTTPRTALCFESPGSDVLILNLGVKHSPRHPPSEGTNPSNCSLRRRPPRPPAPGRPPPGPGLPGRAAHRKKGSSSKQRPRPPNMAAATGALAAAVPASPCRPCPLPHVTPPAAAHWPPPPRRRD